jgi:protein pelota
MKVLRRQINSKTGGGSVSVEAEVDDDMYHLYNLICLGDQVEATTYRNVVTERKSGARDRTRVQTRIMIQVEDVQFDSEDCVLRLKGTNMKENEHLKLGQYHTLTLEEHRPCEIFKEEWDSVFIETLDTLSEPARGADLAVLVMQEGLANLCLVKAALTKYCPKVEKELPKKRQQGNQAYEAAVNKFFGDVYDSVRKHVDFSVVKAVLVGSPGFVKDDFLAYLQARAVREECAVFLKNKNKFVRAHASSGQKRAVAELLGSPEVAAQVGEAKAVDEVRALQAFHDTLSADPDRACYGSAQVMAANEQLAIADLLITDSMYRARHFAERKKYIQLIESVRANGGRVFQFSSLHCSGEQLNLYTGIAAILRFPLPEEADPEPQAAPGPQGAGSGAEHGAEVEEDDDDNDAELLAKRDAGFGDFSDFT